MTQRIAPCRGAGDADPSCEGHSVPATLPVARTIRALSLIVLSAVAVSITVALPATAATITVDAERRGDTIDIRASADLKTDPTTAWRVLTDYERYPEFIPDLRVSRVIARRGAAVTVEQSGSATLWLFRIPLDITFEITELPPYRLHSRAVAGSMRAMSSSYQLRPTPDGTHLDYAGHVAPGFALFAEIEEVAVRQSVSRQFQALVDEIEHRTKAPVGDAGAHVR